MLEHYISQQNENRKLWEGNDTPEGLVQLLADEVAELQEAIQDSMVTGDVFSVASEIGDVGYLLQRLCIDLGIDLNDAITMKLTRNAVKYSDFVMSNGRNYEEAVKASKEYWAVMGGDQRFSHAYLNVLAHDE